MSEILEVKIGYVNPLYDIKNDIKEIKQLYPQGTLKLHNIKYPHISLLAKIFGEENLQGKLVHPQTKMQKK